jgi:hypothetical protein
MFVFISLRTLNRGGKQYKQKLCAGRAQRPLSSRASMQAFRSSELRLSRLSSSALCHREVLKVYTKFRKDMLPPLSGQKSQPKPQTWRGTDYRPITAQTTDTAGQNATQSQQ